MEFVCRVGTPDGRVVEEVLAARDERAVRRDLERRGYRIFEVRGRGLRFTLPAWSGSRKRIKDQDLLLFNQELAGLLKAGLPLLQSLELMLERQRDPTFREVLGEIRDQVKSGEELSTAFQSFGELFPPLYASTLMAGERSGELEQVMRRFVRYLRLVMETRKRITSALIYPTVLVSLSAVMMAVMTVFVLPRFRVFYDAMDVELPLATRFVLGLSVFLRQNGWLLIVGLAVAAFFFSRWAATSAGREWLDRLRIRLPVIGSILHRFAISEFGRSLATLLAGGLPLVPALEVSVNGVGNAFLRRRLEPVLDNVREGTALHTALANTGVVPDLAIDMVKVGEATGALDEMLNNVSDFFDSEIETGIQRLLTLVEPVMLVLMGITVGGLLMAMYLPLFTILGKVQ